MIRARKPKPKPCALCHSCDPCNCYRLSPGELQWWVRVIGTEHFHGPLQGITTNIKARWRGAVIFQVGHDDIEAVYRVVKKKEVQRDVDKYASLGHQPHLS